MPETMTLTTPILGPSLTTLRVESVSLDRAEQVIQIRVVGSDGVRRHYGYEGAVAVSLIAALNKANLSVKSLERRILERLAADYPEIGGPVSGAAD